MVIGDSTRNSVSSSIISRNPNPNKPDTAAAGTLDVAADANAVADTTAEADAEAEPTGSWGIFRLLLGAFLASPSPELLLGAFLADAFLWGVFLAATFLLGAFLADAFLLGAFLADAFLLVAFLAATFLLGVFFLLFAARIRSCKTFSYLSAFVKIFLFTRRFLRGEPESGAASGSSSVKKVCVGYTCVN